VLQALADAYALHQAGKLDAAEAAYAAVLAEAPDDPVALINAGALALSRGDLANALARLARAVAQVPGNAVARNNLGFAQLRAGRVPEALASIDRAIAAKPDYAQAHNNRGIALVRLGRRADARAAFERALALDPALADAAVNLGDLHADAGDAAPAIRAYDAALARQSSHAGAQTGRAFATAQAGDLPGARVAIAGVVATHPHDAGAWQTAGALANWAWDHDGAEAAFRRALALDPARDDAQFGIASSLLARGRYVDGFDAFERRPLGRFGRAPRFPEYPAWQGDTLRGTLLLHAEQGHGDVVQFARFIAPARARVERIVLLADGYHAPLAPLLVSCAGIDAVVTDVAALRDERIAARASVLSLAHLLRIDVNDLPGSIPYLAAPPDAVAAWAARLGGRPAPRIGLAWSVLARDDHAFVTRHKSVPPAALAPLLRGRDATFVTLQPGAAGDPAAFATDAARVVDTRDTLRDFSATAALIGALDLVISADTAVAHVAGALGAPVWLLERAHGCWRWRLAADASPWYPTMTIFRQSRIDAWDDVVARVGAALAGRFPRSAAPAR
jgi:Flp pilus assembly protein TadD